MKGNLIRSLVAVAAATTLGQAQTINWGSEAFSSLVDSKGVVLDETFKFELGAFWNVAQNAAFTPTADNMDQWFSMWHVFDRASYSAANGYFTGTVEMLDNGSSSYAPVPPAGEFNFDVDTQTYLNFQGLNAYLWIRNSEEMVKFGGDEWLLVRPSDPLQWKFPTAKSGCCDEDLPLQWSVSDLSSTSIPQYGYQSGNDGESSYNPVGRGDISTPGAYNLQTATFVPEPASAVMVLVLGVLGLTDRRRTWRA